jgi:hypothetical protein
MQFKPKDIEALLEFKFKFSPAKGKTHRFYELVFDDLPPIRTHVSHGNRATLGDDLYKAIGRELHVGTGFCKAMMNCTKSLKDYLQAIRTHPNPPFRRR